MNERRGVYLIEVYPKGIGYAGILFDRGYYFPNNNKNRVLAISVKPFDKDREVEGILEKSGVNRTDPVTPDSNGIIKRVLSRANNIIEKNRAVRRKAGNSGEGGQSGQPVLENKGVKKKSGSLKKSGVAILKSSATGVVLLEVTDEFLNSENGKFEEMLYKLSEKGWVPSESISEILEKKVIAEEKERGTTAAQSR